LAQEWQETIEETLEKIENIGFFAANGVHMGASSPPWQENAANLIKGSPWECLSPTEQCFKMIHQLAIKAWHNLEGILSFWEPPIGDGLDLGGDKRELVEEIINPREPASINAPSPQFQVIDPESEKIKTEEQVSEYTGGPEDQATDLGQMQVRSLDELMTLMASSKEDDLKKE